MRFQLIAFGRKMGSPFGVEPAKIARANRSGND